MTGAICLVLFCGVFVDAALGSFVGINIGTNIPTAASVVAILRAQQITHIRLFDADARMLNALSDTGIHVMISVSNDEVLPIGQSPSTAADWVNKNVVAYLPRTNITAIAVGTEFLTSIPNANAAPILLSAMNYLYKALVASNLNYLVKVSTPHSMDIIPHPFPPSTATFNGTWNATMFQILHFLRNTNSFYMLNAYPYYEYVRSNGIFPLDYALLSPSANQLVDPNTLFHYSNMFDALVDAAYSSIASLNFSGIPVVVTETGWPWYGGADATVQNAQMYNTNLMMRVLNNSGPPSQPSVPTDTYIYELFNEDKRPGPVWGIFFANGTGVYDLQDANSSSVFCIARSGANQSSLQSGLDWACGEGGANCAAIQQGRSCYEPNTLANHASYAYNDYYQRMRNSGATCDFSGTATLTSNDPSYGSCTFSGSSNSSARGQFPPPAALGPVGPSSQCARNVVHFSVVASLLIAMLYNMNLKMERLCLN